ncbi:MAG: hypothetical protein ACFFAS_01965 [Promethearchaeota archaeon]
MLSKKIQNEEGTSIRVFRFAKTSGMISEKEFDILTKLKNNQEIEECKETKKTLMFF